MSSYQDNLKRWSFFCPDGAKALTTFQPSDAALVQTESGLPNLVVSFEGNHHFIHSQQDPVTEATEFVKKIDTTSYQVIYIYGVGLGYIVDALQEWLGNPKHFLVFLEDNLSVIHRLLESERGKQILHHPQVWLHYIDPSGRGLGDLVSLFTADSFAVEAIDLYDKIHHEKFHELKSKLSSLNTIKKAHNNEYSYFGLGFYENYYRNLFFWPKSHFGLSFKGAFKDIPAIICGAGPSLDKNIEQLRSLSDKALIFAGGTAMNALNAKGILPHFGVGIDPNPEQKSRIIMNTAYETPYFYRNRMNHDALKLIHGELLLISGSEGHDFAQFIEKKLGIKSQYIDEGLNVINFSLSIAAMMGCNPIILVGVDLAYTNNQSYASGIVNHPIHTRKEHFRTKRQSEELVLKEDINGQQVSTLWKWINESLWYSNFSVQYPEVILLNATEGGIGFQGIPNVTLSEVAKDLLKKNIDLEGRVFAQIQNSPMTPEVNEGKISLVLQEVVASLERSAQLYQNLYNELDALLKQNEKEVLSEGWQTAEVQKIQDALNQEIALDCLLRRFQEVITLQKQREKIFIEADKEKLSEKEFIRRQIGLEMYFTSFLQQTASAHVSLIKRILQENLDRSYHEMYQSLYEPPSQYFAEEETRYSYTQNQLIMVDPELNLRHIEEFIPDETKTENYEGGGIKFKSLYKQGILHGPSECFSPAGKLLARSWYIDGVKEGQSLCYYPSGKLYSVERRLNGFYEGKQEYYFEKGSLKSVIPYRKGRLDGEIKLYHSTGKPAWELHFIDGKRDGTEMIWDEQGKFILEAQFKQGKPYGTARAWHPNGVLAQEITYNEQSNVHSSSKWNDQGIPIKEEFVSKEDYFDAITKQTGTVTESLTEAMKQIKTITPILAQMAGGKEGSEQMKDMEREFAEAARQLENLQEMNRTIFAESGLNPENEEESLWKTSSLEREMRGKLEGLTQQVNREIAQLRATLGKTLENIAKKADKKEGG